MNGFGTVASCKLAVKFLKTVATRPSARHNSNAKGSSPVLWQVSERGTWASVLSTAHRQFIAGHTEQALVQYTRAGEEVGRAAAARRPRLGAEPDLLRGMKWRRATQPGCSTKGCLSLRSARTTAPTYTSRSVTTSWRPSRATWMHGVVWETSITTGELSRPGAVPRLMRLASIDTRWVEEPDYEMAAQQYLVAADKQNPQAMFNLG